MNMLAVALAVIMVLHYGPTWLNGSFGATTGVRWGTELPTIQDPTRGPHLGQTLTKYCSVLCWSDTVFTEFIWIKCHSAIKRPISKNCVAQFLGQINLD